MRGSKYFRKTVPQVKTVACPDCGKHRLRKPVNEETGEVEAVSTETVEVNGETRYVDVCEFCQAKYDAADQRFIMENLKKIQKAAQDVSRDSGTDHKDFTLDA